jgi:FtsP/CotA-like multicopper oxidase with cupredoxin domain
MSASLAAIFAGVMATSAAPGAAPAAPTTAPVEYEFEVGMARGAIFNPWTRRDDPVELRSYRGPGVRDGAFVAPEIRVRPGQKLRIRIDNRLPACAEEPDAPPCQNNTNVHTHGLWVSPSGNSDNVMLSIRPGERFQYEFDIAADHPAGTFWYHPHQHGAGVVQVGSGMAGPLIVTGDRRPTTTTPGDIDILLRDERGPFPERTLLFQQIHYGCLDAEGAPKGVMEDGDYVRPWVCEPGEIGRLESPEQDWDWRFSGRFTGINGHVQPDLDGATAGRFERWRLILSSAHEPVRMRLYRLAEDAPDLRMVAGADQDAWRARYCQGDPLKMWRIAADGLTASQVRTTDEAVLFPGERLDVLTWFPAAGRYCVVQDTTRSGRKNDPSRMLAVLEVGRGRAVPVEANPTALLQARLVAAAERALSAPEQAEIRTKVVADLNDGLKTSAFVWHKPVAREEITGAREVLLNITSSPVGDRFTVNGRPFEHGRVDMRLPLGGVEQWSVASVPGGGGHPLHIHVNPFQIIAIYNAEGKRVSDPASPAFDPDYAGLAGEWKDTLFVKDGHRAVIRTRFERYTGDFVLHCHLLFHADHGMMQHLRIVDPSSPEVAEARPH